MKYIVVFYKDGKMVTIEVSDYGVAVELATSMGGTILP